MPEIRVPLLHVIRSGIWRTSCIKNKSSFSNLNSEMHLSFSILSKLNLWYFQNGKLQKLKQKTNFTALYYHWYFWRRKYVLKVYQKYQLMNMRISKACLFNLHQIMWMKIVIPKWRAVSFQLFNGVYIFHWVIISFIFTVKLQLWSYYFETFWCLTNISFHHKQNETWLLVMINMVHFSCLMSWRAILGN